VTTAVAAWLILCLIHFELPTTQLVTVQALNGARRVGAWHLDETEASGTSRLSVIDEGNRVHRAVLLEELAHSCFISCEREVAYVNLTHGKRPLNDFVS